MSTPLCRTAQAIRPRRRPRALVPLLGGKGLSFTASPNAAKKPYSIVIPPPNVTGALHLGHALNNTLQDILIRQKRMQGFETLWMPGTDHAGIATQAVVERRLLAEEKLSRHELGREGLVARIWQWKNDYEARILGQLKQMGCSCDWQRTRFTLDPVCARAVRHTFFSLFRDGLIYRGKRLVNWDTMLQTAVSDDEVFHEAVAGHFWYFNYPVIDPRPGEPAHVTIATTRPETMLGDTAVAVHPDPAAALAKAEAELEARLAAAPAKQKPELEAELDDVRQRRKTMLPELRQAPRHGPATAARCCLPLVEREIPLVADVWAKPELGTGCVKITPAHDPNDYEVGLRQKLPMINILNLDGTLNDERRAVRGQTVLEARENVVADLEKLGLVAKVEDREIDLAHSDRSKTPIEPLLTDQWFVKMERLAQTAMDAVTDGRVRIIPERYTKGYLDWLEREARLADQPAALVGTPDSDLVLQDGQRGRAAAVPSPAATTSSGSATSTTANGSSAPRKKTCRRRSCPAISSSREQDVLDTWFSSALWPHSTLGWPEQTPELKYYYPTSVLITSRDIITLWVARMVLTGLYNVGEVPFHDVFIHPKILDAYGEGMSKSKGNGVDPDRRDREVRRRFAALRPGLPDDRDAGHPHAGRVRVPALPGADRADQGEPRAAADQVQAVRQGVLHAMGREARRQGPAARGGGERPLRAGAELLQQALERLAVRADEPGGLHAGPRGRRGTARRRPLDPQPAGHGYGRGDRGPGRVSLCRRRRAALRLRLGRVLQLLRRDGQGRLGDESARPVAQRVLAHTLDTLLRLLHPMVPFVTEEVWQLLAAVAPGGVSTPSSRRPRAS